SEKSIPSSRLTSIFAQLIREGFLEVDFFRSPLHIQIVLTSTRCFDPLQLERVVPSGRQGGAEELTAESAGLRRRKVLSTSGLLGDRTRALSHDIPAALC